MVAQIGAFVFGRSHHSRVWRNLGWPKIFTVTKRVVNGIIGFTSTCGVFKTHSFIFLPPKCV
jgi:hypothetical protein